MQEVFWSHKKPGINHSLSGQDSIKLTPGSSMAQTL